MNTPARPSAVPAGLQGKTPPPAGAREPKRPLPPEVVFAEDLCKGCELCITVCPTRVLKIDTARVNRLGYYPAVMVNLAGCSGCGSCAKICPDSIITVRR